MYDLPASYDAWRTWTPDQDAPDPLPTCCDVCDHESEDAADGTTCDECGEGTMREVEPMEPCRCYGDKCYC